MYQSSKTQITADLTNAGVPEELAKFTAEIIRQENSGQRQLSDRTSDEKLAIGVVKYIVTHS